MNNNQTNFWTTLPGILAGVAGVITAITGLIIVFKPTDKPTNISQKKVFICGIEKDTTEEKIPTTIVQTNRGDVPMFFWKDESFGPEWTPIQRCQEVSRRLQSFHDENNLNYIATGILNKYPVLCVNKTTFGGCKEQNLLITLKSGEDPSEVLKEILVFRDSEIKKAIVRGGSISFLDVNEYLNQAPVSKKSERLF